MTFLRNPEILKKMGDISEKVVITQDDYNLVMAYAWARLIFSNGARAEYGYKAMKDSLRDYVWVVTKYSH